jgi:hypothetical protein
VNDKAFLPAILDKPDPQTAETYAKVALVIAARAVSPAEALELGGMLGLPERSWVHAQWLLQAGDC